MPSVRSRIKQFESLSGENDKSSEEPSKANKPAKKFLYPGHSSQLDQRQSPIDHVINPQAAKQSGDHYNGGMSNKLEEVWSVRRNIGVGRNVNSTISQLTANMYSRHGALPATAGQPHLPPVVSKKDAGELTSFGRSRSPLQDHNHCDGARLRNVRAGGYSYSEAKRSHDLPPNMDMSSSKHKSLGIAAMIRPSDNGLLPPVNHKNDKKRRYAEKMANAHLKSAGIGEYTPKNTYYTKIQSSNGDQPAAGPSSRWKPRSSSEDDDFDF